jgi:hypothetical protein
MPHVFHDRPEQCVTALVARLAKVRAIVVGAGSCGETGCTTVATCELLRVLDEKTLAAEALAGSVAQ